MQNKTIKNIIFIIFVVLMFLPLIQQIFPVVKQKDLIGYSEKIPKPKISMETWFEGTFQSEMDKYTNENIGYRNFLIRNYNQIRYSLFNTTNANGAIIGKDNYLYILGYIENYLGLNYIGEDLIKNNVKHLSIVRDSLKAKGIDLVVLIAPGKGSFYPEYLPKQYVNLKPKKTNFEVYNRELIKNNIHYLDFNSWILSLKGKTPYRLFPNTGVHWGQYACYLANDSITRYFEKLYSIRLPHLKIKNIRVTDTMFGKDDDVEKLMNIYTNIPDIPMPKIDYIVDSNKGNVDKLKVLTIGDSYYSGLSELGLDQYVFYDSEYWYYFKQIMKNNKYKGTTEDYDKVKDEIEKYKVVFIVVTEGTLQFTLNQFFEELYSFYNNGFFDKEYKRMIDKYVKCINNNKEWLDSVKKKAKQRNVSLDRAIKDDADYMAKQYMLKEYHKKM